MSPMLCPDDDADGVPVSTPPPQSQQPDTFAPHMLELSIEEIYALDLCVHNDDADDGQPVAKPLLLRLGGVWIDFLNIEEAARPNTVSLAITEREAWLLRDHIPLMLQIGSKMVGLALKEKIYRLLLQYDVEHEADAVLRTLREGAAKLADQTTASPAILEEPAHDPLEAPKRRRGRPRKGE